LKRAYLEENGKIDEGGSYLVSEDRLLRMRNKDCVCNHGNRSGSGGFRPERTDSLGLRFSFLQF